jgi:Tfp pilus assembly pilus retraction ATPase PilT
MLYTLSTLLEMMLAERADGLHLHPGETPVLELARNLFRISGPPIEAGDVEALLRQISSKEEFREFQSSGIVLCYHHLPGRGWFAVMAFREQAQIRLEIRSLR